MPIQPITNERVRQLSEDLGLSIEDFSTYTALINGWLGAYAALDSMPDNTPPVRYPRIDVRRPDPEENPHNAWSYKADIRGAVAGKLLGRKVAIKDNVLVAGIPMSNGSTTLNGYVPEFDATVVTRILDAGGTIAGKANCEWFCYSGGSYTNCTGPIHNPHKRGFSAGGSSSGCGVVVATGEVDMAIGCDQGGSIRIPSAQCGIYGMKPTHGLVPYTGILSMEPLVDHVGPMTATVRDNAILLEVIAGPDGIDSRQEGAQPRAYSELLSGGAAGLRIAVVEEGFGHLDSEADVDETVRHAAELFKKLRASVHSVSIPLHHAGMAIGLPLYIEGIGQTMRADTIGSAVSNTYPVSLMDHHRNWVKRLAEFPPHIKLAYLLEKYVTEQAGYRYYGKAVNVSRTLRDAYDAVLRDYDLLLMPTVVAKAKRLPDSSWTEAQLCIGTTDTLANTAPFDVTHHPAMSVPCGMRDGLPIGMMLVGRHYDEATIYRAAFGFEQAQDWKQL